MAFKMKGSAFYGHGNQSPQGKGNSAMKDKQPRPHKHEIKPLSNPRPKGSALKHAAHYPGNKADHTLASHGEKLAGDVSAIASGVGQVASEAFNPQRQERDILQVGDEYTKGKSKKETAQRVAEWEEGGKEGPKPTYVSPGEKKVRAKETHKANIRKWEEGGKEGPKPQYSE